MSLSKLNSMLTKHLLATNIGVSVALSAFGDAITQHRSQNQNRINLRRSCHMGVSFGLTSGFLCHYWYNFLDKKIPGRTISVVVRKIICDQLLFSPVCIITCLLVSGLIERSVPKAIWGEVKEKGVKLYLAEWFIWPPAQFFNFYLLPTRFRVIFDNMVSLGYDMYTSHVKYPKEEAFDQEPEQGTWWRSAYNTKSI